ncbi:protein STRICTOSIDINE SYNTHASE-LIKE 10-like protein [Cinnamomum micranthum f. kanehirae]|uniref:Protein STRICTOSIDINE SYNTHASE-LIKE 10-like protein n=1 Tax=Cinnamomum micranthum f. kanehirae TaxID=337451 RepID=A0A443NES0_9MAGN|nr:protein STRICTOSIDINE SYNTHASE-LIKE 10-like protein [Cinnamomum micranthum f. kanehirae]
MKIIHSFIPTMGIFPTFSIITFLLLLLLPSSSPHPPQVQARIDIVRDFSRIALPGSIGPETIDFDSAGEGPYTGVSDGRVLKWLGDERGWIEFATTSRERKKGECDGTHDPKLEDTCGRPLGLRFYNATGDLYIVDAYFGLLMVGGHGGLATQLATSAEGVPFRFTNAVDIDQTSGFVYFTDSSTRFQRRDYIWAIRTRDKTGRLMQYDPKSKQVTVLLRGLFFANGVALSKDKTFLVVAETTTGRILRYWLQGPKMGEHEVFAQLPGFLDNINRNSKGEFWVAINCVDHQLGNFSFSNELRRKGNCISIIRKFNIVQPTWVDYSVIGVKLSEEGEIMELLYVDDGTIANLASELKEENERLWLGSVVMPFAGVTKL